MGWRGLCSPHRDVAAQTSVTEYVKQLPAPSPAAAAGLLLTLRTPGQAKTQAKALAKRGYLGCYPFAHTKRDDVVLRLLPNSAAEESPVGVVFADSPDAWTIAPKLQHFVAGRLAQINYCNPAVKRPADQQAEILAYAEALGGGESARAVLAACGKASKTAGAPERGALWLAARDFDPLFEVLGGAWTHRLKEVPGWLQTLRVQAREHPIARNIRVSHHTRFKTGEDVAEDAWAIVFGDQVFDRGYTGITRGIVRGSQELNAVHSAVTWLRQNGTKDARFDSPEWEAAQAAADDAQYDGQAHVRAATARAKADPAAAYIQLANAAYYAARRRGAAAAVAKIVQAARDLAKKQKWTDLAEVLAMSITSST